MKRVNPNPSDPFKHAPCGCPWEQCGCMMTTCQHIKHNKKCARETSDVKPQPAPKRKKSKPIWDLVIADMAQRDQDGRRKYGTPLQAHNGRDPLIDAYQEALDLAVYLKQAIVERDS